MPTASSRLAEPPSRGHQPGRDAGAARVHGDQVVGEAQQHDAEQGDDGQLEPAVAALVQGQDAERHDRGDQPGQQQRRAEQQVQPDGGADELGHVGCHRHQLGLHPQAAGHRARQLLTAQLRQVLPVATPILADRYCTSIAIRLAMTMTQARV